MTLELIRDALRDSAWWLLVSGSEQSFVDTEDPLHLEFEYIQLMAYVLETQYADDAPLAALHLGGGLCTIPRWLAATHPGSRQRVIELSAEVAKLAKSLGMPTGITIARADAVDALGRARRHSVDLLVSDVYQGPETVTSVFTIASIEQAHQTLKLGGLYLCNLSDATPFTMSKVVVAAVRDTFANLVLLAEPPVLRGRRSGNLVIAASDASLDVPELTRRASGGPIRGRVVAGADLEDFVGDAKPAQAATDVPASQESLMALRELAQITSIGSAASRRRE